VLDLSNMDLNIRGVRKVFVSDPKMWSSTPIKMGSP
jgi:hypothetical protein